MYNYKEIRVYIFRHFLTGRFGVAMFPHEAFRNAKVPKGALKTTTDYSMIVLPKGATGYDLVDGGRVVWQNGPQSAETCAKVVRYDPKGYTVGVGPGKWEITESDA